MTVTIDHQEKLLPLLRGYDPIRLFCEDTGNLGCYACGKCRKLFSVENIQFAEMCCIEPSCATSKCLNPVSKYRVRCDTCRARIEEEEELKRFSRSSKINYCDWTGELMYSEAMQAYFCDWGTYREELETFGEEEEKYLYDTNAMKLHIDALCIAETALQDFNEGSLEEADIDGLQVLLDSWCKKQEISDCYQPSINVVIMAPSKE